jgi:Ca2+-binding RTX toxin-like protein
VAVGHVSANQEQTCTAGASTADGASSVDGLVVAGIPVSIVGSQVIDQTIAGIRIRTNQTDGTSRQALIVDIGTSQYVVGDVRASGDACASLQNGGGNGTLDKVCPSGATYDVVANVCVIRSTDSSGTTTTTVVGKPYAGPAGGTVITLTDARSRARQGTLPNSRCLQGPGPKYVVIGTAGNDHITGTNGGDRILGLGGSDRIDGGRGNDCVDGNTGADTLTGGEGSDRVYGAAGNDHLNGGPGNDVLSGGGGRDTINTGFGRDRVTGGAGNDAINAATAGPPATIDGGPGHNTVRINKNERRHTRRATILHVIK